MIHTILAFPHIVAEHILLAYIILSLSMLIEGEVALILSGIFLHFKIFHLFPVLSIIIFVAFFKTFIAYKIGEILQEKYPQSVFLKGITRRVEALLPRFYEKPFWSLFTARFLTLGMHIFSLVFSGYKNINFKRVFKAEASSLFVWVPSMLSIGYFFSYTAFSISHDIRKVFIIVLIFILCFVILEKVLREFFAVVNLK